MPRFPSGNAGVVFSAEPRGAGVLFRRTFSFEPYCSTGRHAFQAGRQADQLARRPHAPRHRPASWPPGERRSRWPGSRFHKARAAPRQICADDRISLSLMDALRRMNGRSGESISAPAVFFKEAYHAQKQTVARWMVCGFFNDRVPRLQSISRRTHGAGRRTIGSRRL
jgi:hypothetical protein